MLDSYLFGSTARISPEAPVPVVEVTHTQDRLGGAGNVALNIKKMGAKPFLLSYTGTDTVAERFFKLCEENHIATNLLFQSKTRITTQKSRIISRNQQMLRFD